LYINYLDYSTSWFKCTKKKFDYTIMNVMIIALMFIFSVKINFASLNLKRDDQIIF